MLHVFNPINWIDSTNFLRPVYRIMLNLVTHRWRLLKYAVSKAGNLIGRKQKSDRPTTMRRSIKPGILCVC